MNKTVGDILREFDNNPTKKDPVILIDAVKLIKHMYEDGRFSLFVADSAYSAIEKQPVAYDVDRVISQIRYNSYNSGYEPPITKIGTKKAVEIINAGGVN